jgi:hypothetical protein
MSEKKESRSQKSEDFYSLPLEGGGKGGSGMVKITPPPGLPPERGKGLFFITIRYGVALLRNLNRSLSVERIKVVLVEMMDLYVSIVRVNS